MTRLRSGHPHTFVLPTVPPRPRRGVHRARAFNRRKQGRTRLAPPQAGFESALADAAIKPPRAAHAR
ncbi:MAG TPA: hypothetical protein VJS18_10615 [Paraburkholderia sp.]|nr:hypothetical protein [Paraburkholderia sp.]